MQAHSSVAQVGFLLSFTVSYKFWPTFFKHNTEQSVTCSVKVNLIDISENTARFLILPKWIFLWAGYQFSVLHHSHFSLGCWPLLWELCSAASQLEQFCLTSRAHRPKGCSEISAHFHVHTLTELTLEEEKRMENGVRLNK